MRAPASLRALVPFWMPAWCAPLLLALGLMLAVAPGAPLQALELAPVLQDGMVLQANSPIVIWGERAPSGATVVVQLGGEEIGRGQAAADGSWQVQAGPLAYRPGHEATTLTVTCNRTRVERKDVRVGEVWLCVGQSNMRFRLGRLAEPRNAGDPPLYPETLRAATDSRLHLLNVSGGTPKNRRWAPCTPESVAEFSAIGYHFGRSLADVLDVPVGLVDLGMGGLPIRGFLPAPAPNTELERLIGPADDRTDRIYTRDFRWFAPYGVAGVLWYQGESDVARADTYTQVMGVLMARWRADLQSPDLPFLIVPITPYERRLTDAPSAEPPRRSAAMRAVLESLPDYYRHVWAIPSLDLGERFDIHPRRKREVGDRLARAALANVYELPVRWAGPRVAQIRQDADGWTLTLRNTEGGLVVTGDSLRGFEIETEPGVWAEARAEVLGNDRIRVWAGESDHRGGVRYGWWSWFVPTVVNGDGFPLGTFSWSGGSE